MIIEKATPGDAEALAPLMEQLMSEPAHPDKIAQTLAQIEKNPAYYLLVAREEGRILGTMMGIVCYDISVNCDPFMVVENVAELERIASEHHCTTLMLCSSIERTGAHDFYRRLGFSDTITKGFKKKVSG